MLKLKKLFILFSLIITITFINCNSSKNGLKEKEPKEEKTAMLKKDVASIPLAPGTAEVSCVVTNVFEKDEMSYCKIKVNEVIKYGPATKPIAVGSELDLQIENNMIERIDSFIVKKTEPVFTIVNSQGGMGQTELNSWRIIKITE